MPEKTKAEIRREKVIAFLLEPDVLDIDRTDSPRRLLVRHKFTHKEIEVDLCCFTMDKTNRLSLLSIPYPKETETICCIERSRAY